MSNQDRDANGTDSGLTGRGLEEHIGRLEYERPDLVQRVFAEADGEQVVGQAVVKRAAPRRRGKFAAIDPAELPQRWADAVAVIDRRSPNVTLQAIASELGVTERTASRYRRRYGLKVGDR